MATSSISPHHLLLILLSISLHLHTSHSQTTSTNSSTSCNEIYVSYTYTSGAKLTPNVSTPSRQPYSFKSTLTVLNNGLLDLQNWQVLVGFQHGEYLVSASNAVLVDGSALPANVSDGAIFAGYPTSDLKSAVETAGDLTQMAVNVELVGTEFGVDPKSFPLPKNLSLANDGFICPSSPTKRGKSVLEICCARDPKANATATSSSDETSFLPRRTGSDISISYDVTKAYASDYWAQVTISNEDPITRIDNWHLTFQWMRQEFIYEMRGAYPTILTPSTCIYGPQSDYYKALDLSTALTCDSTPTLADLPASLADDTKLGNVNSCCRNGTLLPPTMDPDQSNSSFLVHVYKMPPDVANATAIHPPQSWSISSSSASSNGQSYKCSNPVRVSPSLLPNPDGRIPAPVEAIASWQVVCNRTKPKSPTCCVSFSSYASDAAVPCPTCACGCTKENLKLTGTGTCNATAEAVSIPAYALLLPFENRTSIIKSYASLKHLNAPNPLPCGDYCGVSVNWHLNSDYSDGWTSRVSVFNWGEEAYDDWFMAVEMAEAGPGFEAAYSFNGTRLTEGEGEGNGKMIFMHGIKGFNEYLLAESNGSNPVKDPRVPGKVQSLLSFKKKATPGIDVVGGGGYPVKVYFNGEECAVPTTLPSGSGRLVGAGIWRFLVGGLVALWWWCL